MISRALLNAPFFIPKDADLLRNRKVNTKKRQNRHLPELAFLILGTYFTAPLEYFCRYFLQTYFLLVIPDPSTHHLRQRSHQRTDLSASGIVQMDSESLSEHRRSAGRE